MGKSANRQASTLSLRWRTPERTEVHVTLSMSKIVGVAVVLALATGPRVSTNDQGASIHQIGTEETH